MSGDGGSVAVKFVDVVVADRKEGYGVAFARSDRAVSEDSPHVTPIKGSALPRAIEEEDLARKRLMSPAGEIPSPPAVGSKGTPAERADKPLCVIKSAKAQRRREENSTWTVLSSFPENLPPGIAPVHNHGHSPFTRDVRTGPDPGAETGTLPAPNWPVAEKD